MHTASNKQMLQSNYMKNTLYTNPQIIVRSIYRFICLQKAGNINIK